MQPNRVLEETRRGEVTLGCFVGLGSANVVELLGHAGIHWLVLETEHNGLDSAEVEHLVRAANTTPAVPIVRVPSANPVYIQRALRASHYGLDNADYLANANDNMLVALIVETREALENIDAIAAVPGVDVLYLGLFDLCLSLGLNPLDLPHPEIDAAIEVVLATARRHGVAVGNGASTADGIQALRKQGFTFIGFGPDYALLTAAARAGVEALR